MALKWTIFLCLRIQPVMRRLATLSCVYLLAIAWPQMSRAATLSCEDVLAPAKQSLHSRRVQEIIEAFWKGSPDFGLAHGWAQRILSQKPVTQLAWRKAIGQAYRQVPKKNPDVLASRSIGGRRLLDRLLMLIERPELEFQQRLEAGDTPEVAYARFLKGRRDQMGTGYDFREVNLVLEFIRQRLRDLVTQSPSRFPYKVMLGGSFLNGKAHLLESDIDLSINNADIKRAVESWQPQIKELLAQNGVRTDMKIAPQLEPSAFYGALNSFVIEISTQVKGKKIETVVDVLVFGLASQNGGNLEARTPLQFRFSSSTEPPR